VIGKFFDTTEVDRFADWIIGEVKRALPAGHDPSAKNIAQRAENLNKQIEQQTRVFCKSTKLNIYKKARLAARVREGMDEHGYPKPFIQSFSLDLLRRIHATSNKAAG
jgi:hypothetical protein